ncbi:sulfotransferase domain-containing protein [Stackebrandtia nassauensis]|uniref:Sulfotransferase n=1 Tax=Stackebrandtia nassauensis (strain DSM 44728 / CIP 108903 / NRRL B-16338 / NBRC 102104 / LLR-40K-21) TaxID=446470 RepID=D3Q948_STANL|nr:sulfotransferase domain-containing protein [Stackebrandtia nassauensis]ADD40657.1 sulfotransferase [Stackebrandtia nassauensis DSM 44728]
MIKLRTERVPAPVKRIIHSGSRAYGRLTAASRLLPGFLLCGGQRCGTTTLYRALSTHPAILKPILHKGVHFFDTGYDNGLPWYQAHFPTRAGAIRISEHTGLAAQAFESSPYYLYHPLAAERFARDLPGVKLIVLVRDPVERARSQHAHEVARGFEPHTDFEAALAAEDERLAGEADRLSWDSHYYSFSHQHHAYRARGRYTEHLERIAKVVSPERIHVVDSGEFFADPVNVYTRVLDFLGLPLLGKPNFAKHNARPRAAAKNSALDVSLSEYFEPFDARLRDWLGADPSWRR